jgi:hypothetical protein
VDETPDATPGSFIALATVPVISRRRDISQVKLRKIFGAAATSDCMDPPGASPGWIVLMMMMMPKFGHRLLPSWSKEKFTEV